MLMIEDVLISEDLLEEQFICNLRACKGACCWEGDFGAPIEEEERHTLEHIYEAVKPFLSPRGRAVIEQEGPYTYYEDNDSHGTPLVDGGACAYMTYDEKASPSVASNRPIMPVKRTLKSPFPAICIPFG